MFLIVSVCMCVNVCLYACLCLVWVCCIYTYECMCAHMHVSVYIIVKTRVDIRCLLQLLPIFMFLRQEREVHLFGWTCSTERELLWIYPSLTSTVLDQTMHHPNSYTC